MKLGFLDLKDIAEAIYGLIVGRRRLLGILWLWGSIIAIVIVLSLVTRIWLGSMAVARVEALAGIVVAGSLSTHSIYGVQHGNEMNTGAGENFCTVDLSQS
jgi:hypothetical protein